MARRRRRNSGNNSSALFLILLAILMYLLFPRLQNTIGQNDLANKDSVNIEESNNKNEESKEQHDIVAFVVGNTENSPAPKITEDKNIKDTLEDVFYSTESGELPNIVLFSATANPKTIEIDDNII